MRDYVEETTYDEVGNITEMRHLSGPSNSESWSRRYDYAEDSNRLLATSIASDQPGQFSAAYTYDAHGSMTSMPHLSTLAWDYEGRLQHTERSGGGGQLTYFTYDAGGRRVRKVYEHNNVVEERIYLGAFELYRKRSGTNTSSVELERETLHINDGARRIVMVETKTVDIHDEEPTIPLGGSRFRYQLDDHLSSSVMEVDEAAEVISYEEYHPYGSTAFHLFAGNAEVSAKRYRYTGKERDSETDLYYHGARYYAPWLGRWTAADPAGLVDGLNLYRYSRDNPVNFSDPGGTQSIPQGPQTINVFDPKNPKASGVRRVRSLRPAAQPKAPTPAPEESVGSGFGEGIHLDELTDPYDPLNPNLDGGSGGRGGESSPGTGTGGPGTGTAGSGTSSGGDVGGSTGKGSGEGEGTGAGKGGTSGGVERSSTRFLAEAAALVSPGEAQEGGSAYGNVGGQAEKGSFLDNAAGQALIAGALIADFVMTAVSLGKLAAAAIGKGVGALAKGAFQAIKQAGTAIGTAFGKAGAALGKAASAVGGFFRNLFRRKTTRGGGGPGSGLTSQTREQLIKSQASYEKLIAEHQQKLADFRANPLAHDNKGLLKNAPTDEIRQKIIEGRIKVLEGQLAKQQGELAKIKNLLRD